MSFANKMLHIFHPVLASLPPGWLATPLETAGEPGRGHSGPAKRMQPLLRGRGKGGGRLVCLFLRWPGRAKPTSPLSGGHPSAFSKALFPEKCVCVC